MRGKERGPEANDNRELKAAFAKTTDSLGPQMPNGQLRAGLFLASLPSFCVCLQIPAQLAYSHVNYLRSVHLKSVKVY